MSEHFAKIAFTPGVRAMQQRYNGHPAPLMADVELAELGQRERHFITARDSFYLATTSSTGWPHVQHRGGAPGFLKVINGLTLAFPDFGGNRQFISVGNLGDNPSAALILMDYPNRRRLKILGTVEVCTAATAEPALLATVASGSDAPPTERIMLIRVAAFDWNCSQHITPRYSESELAALGYTLAQSQPSQGEQHEIV